MKTLHVDPTTYDKCSDFDCIKEDLFLVKNICKGHQRARDDLVKKYSSYIDTEAEYYSNVHVSAKELVQEGIYGLLCATKKFNPKKSKDF